MNALLPTAAPVRPFLDWPVVTDPARWSADVALIGIQHSEPYAGDPRPNDQARAPDAVRLASSNISFGPNQWDFELGGPRAACLPERCLDVGNVAWVAGSYDDYAAQISDRLRHLWRQHAQIVLVGGDHGVTIPALDALDALGEPVYIVHIDAHLDWREDVGGVTRGYSSPLRWASRKSWVKGMTQIGMRSTGSAREGEVNAAREYGSKVFTADVVRSQGLAPVLATIPPKLPLYVTIDADGMDPTEMPGVMAPAPGGLRYEQVAPFLRGLAERQRIVGIDLVEIAPQFDFANGLTCITGGRLLLNAIAASWGTNGACRATRQARAAGRSTLSARQTAIV
jgi:agmatinase